MNPGRPSAHERWVAAHRVRLERTRPSTPTGDVEAERRLYLDVAGRMPAPAQPAGALALQTRAIDEAVARALGQGIAQVVLIGAGYDGRALRFGGGRSRWFEVDRGAMLADKRRRLRSLGVEGRHSVDVVVDAPGTATLGRALHSAGHDATTSTLFVCEEVAQRSTLEAMAELGAALRARAGPASALVAGFEVAPEGSGPVRALRAVGARISQPATRPAVGAYRPGDPEMLMVVTGWRVERVDATEPGRVVGNRRTVVLAAAARVT